MWRAKVSTYKGHETERMRELEGVRLAPFHLRVLAYVVDFLLFGALFLLVAMPAVSWYYSRQPGSEHKHVDIHVDFHNLYSLVALVLYFGLSLYWGHGQTPGKRLFKIRVVSLVHEHLSLWHCFERALGYGASMLEGGFGFLQYFIDPNCRTVHDRIAGTIVVDERERDRLSESSVQLSPDEARALSEGWRKRLAGQMTSDSADLVREDRE